MPHSIELTEQLVAASNKVRDLQEEVARLKEEVDLVAQSRDILAFECEEFEEEVVRLKEENARLDHAKCKAQLNYLETRGALESIAKNSMPKDWMVKCAKQALADHRSGTCPTITKVQTDEKHTDAEDMIELLKNSNRNFMDTISRANE